MDWGKIEINNQNKRVTGIIINQNINKIFIKLIAPQKQQFFPHTKVRI